MKTIVLKFGGTSVGSIDRIKKVSKIIASYKNKRNNVVVVSSAMSGVTNDLIAKSKKLIIILIQLNTMHYCLQENRYLVH